MTTRLERPGSWRKQQRFAAVGIDVEEALRPSLIVYPLNALLAGR
ncbi:hypothetical protein ACLK19_26335 [Escherichia coli]